LREKSAIFRLADGLQLQAELLVGQFGPDAGGFGNVGGTLYPDGLARRRLLMDERNLVERNVLTSANGRTYDRQHQIVQRVVELGGFAIDSLRFDALEDIPHLPSQRLKVGDIGPKQGLVERLLASADEIERTRLHVGRKRLPRPPHPVKIAAVAQKDDGRTQPRNAAEDRHLVIGIAENHGCGRHRGSWRGSDADGRVSHEAGTNAVDCLPGNSQ
jgi:hypothetical protein